jgi:hypothetical protein
MLRVFRAVANPNIRLGRGLDSIQAHRQDGKDQFLIPARHVSQSCRAVQGPSAWFAIATRGWTRGVQPKASRRHKSRNAQAIAGSGRSNSASCEVSVIAGTRSHLKLRFAEAAILGHSIIYRADTTVSAPGKLRLFHIADHVAGLPLKQTLGLMSVMCVPPAFSPILCSERAVRVSLSMGQAVCTPSP